MRMTRLLLLIAMLGVAFTSCQKEVGFDDRDPGGGTTTDAGNIVGDYDFVGMTASTVSSGTFTMAGETMKNVTTSYYITKNNSGTVKITATDMSTVDMAYDIDTTMKLTTYVNGVLLDELEMPMVFSTPPSSNTSPYVRNTPDSITVTGTFISAPGSSLPAAPGTTSAGLRLSWSGDTLVMRTKTGITTTTDMAGIPGTLVASVDAVIKLKKKP